MVCMCVSIHSQVKGLKVARVNISMGTGVTVDVMAFGRELPLFDHVLQAGMLHSVPFL